MEPASDEDPADPPCHSISCTFSIMQNASVGHMTARTSHPCSCMLNAFRPHLTYKVLAADDEFDSRPKKDVASITTTEANERPNSDLRLRSTSIKSSRASANGNNLHSKKRRADTIMSGRDKMAKGRSTLQAVGNDPDTRNPNICVGSSESLGQHKEAVYSPQVAFMINDAAAVNVEFASQLKEMSSIISAKAIKGSDAKSSRISDLSGYEKSSTKSNILATKKRKADDTIMAAKDKITKAVCTQHIMGSDLSAINHHICPESSESWGQQQGYITTPQVKGSLI